VYLLGHAEDAGLIAHIERDRVRTPAERFDFGNEWRQIIRPSAGKDEVRAGKRQRAREMLAETAAGSSNQRYLTREIEQCSVRSGMHAGIHAGAPS
jgi:hypothetical protein